MGSRGKRTQVAFSKPQNPHSTVSPMCIKSGSDVAYETIHILKSTGGREYTAHLCQGMH